MKIAPDKRLFWFLKDDAQLDLESPAILDMYVQQTVTHGLNQDIKTLISRIGLSRFKESFQRIKPFLSWEIRKFWEDCFGNA